MACICPGRRWAEETNIITVHLPASNTCMVLEETEASSLLETGLFHPAGRLGPMKGSGLCTWYPGYLQMK